MNLSLIPMTNKSHVRLIFAKDVCVFTLKRSIKSFLIIVIVFTCFWFIVFFHRASESSPVTTITTTTKTIIKPIPIPHLKEPHNQSFPAVHDSKNNSFARVLNKNETVSNEAYPKYENVNGSAISRKFISVSLY